MKKNIKQILLTLFGLVLVRSSYSSSEGMPSMPKLESTKIRTVKADDDFESEKGFGDQAPMVRMMNLMMVEGSGVEGMSMDMSKETAKASTEKMDPKNYEISASSPSGSVNVGTNTIEISITDQKNKKPVKGLKLKAQVFMTSMNMGTEEPQVKEIGAGKYQVKAPFAMDGPWAIKLILPDGKEKLLNFDVPTKK
jgi:hypothetical protein